jgi:hypothetical protein
MVMWYGCRGGVQILQKYGEETISADAVLDEVHSQRQVYRRYAGIIGLNNHEAAVGHVRPCFRSSGRGSGGYPRLLLQ